MRQAFATTSFRRSFYFTLALLLLVGLVAAGWWYWQREVVATVDYDPCEADYGEVVAQWQGESDEEWDDEEYYYQTRSFWVQAYAPDVRFPNTVEASPTYIATGGEDACGDFDEEIDTVSDYRWDGARTVQVGFGAPEPAFADDSQPIAAESPRIEPDSELVQSVSATAERASVWVDDGARGLISGEQVWCLNHSDCNGVNQDASRRGAGYQHRTESCPDEEVCSDEWYDTEFLQSLSTDDVVEPFDLRLEAVSTYAPVVGAEMMLTFQYPREVTLETDTVGEEPIGVDPDTETVVEFDLAKHGRAINELTLRSQHPAITEADFGEDVKEQLDGLNRSDRYRFQALLDVDNDQLDSGECIDPQLELQASYGDEREAQTSVATELCATDPPQVYNYSVQTRGSTESDIGEFGKQVQETLDDPRGWRRANTEFRQTENGGDFVMWLAAPEAMTSFAEGCSPDYSCRVGDNVIVNDERWQNATASWNEAGGDLRGYRHMVVNHEVGHFLGHGHFDCPEPGQPAPVMQQQSIDLQGCEFNPWPLTFEVEWL